MESLTQFIDTYHLHITIATLTLCLLSLVFIIIQQIKLSKLNRAYKKMFKGENVTNIEDMLLSNKAELVSIKETHTDILDQLDSIFKSLKKCYCKSAMHKYDAFTGLAGKLSFVYVLLDEMNSGVILNGIYSSEGHYLYIKDVVNGKTEKELSKEERLTLEKIVQK